MMDLHAGGSLYLSNMLKHLGSYIVELLFCVFVLVVPDRKMNLLVESITMVILVMFWN
jgi:hypothetical protein